MEKKRERIYSDYDKEYQSRPKQVKKRVERNKARRMKTRQVGKVALKGKDVGHIKSLEKGGKTTSKNIVVVSCNKNRSDKSMMKKK